jgi:hypothetical protein
LPEIQAFHMEQLLAAFLTALARYVIGPIAVRWFEKRLKSRSKRRRKH